MLRFVFYGVAVMLLANQTASAQCPNGRCPTPNARINGGYYVPSPSVVISQPVVQTIDAKWYSLKGDPSKVLLFSGDTYIGVYDPFTAEWKSATGEVKNLQDFASEYGARPFGQKKKTDCPECDELKLKGKLSMGKPGCQCEDCQCNLTPKLYGAGPPEINTRDAKPIDIPGGVDVTKIRSDGDHYTMVGQQCSRAEALSSLEAAGNVPNDSTHVRFTVIGGEAARKQVLADLETRPEFAAFRGKFVVSEWASDNQRIKDGGFKVPSSPTGVMIYVQKADGTVLWRQEGYDSPTKLAKALRDKVPGYDPSKDPNPDSVPLAPPIEPKRVGSNFLLWLMGLLGVGGATFYAYRRK